MVIKVSTLIIGGGLSGLHAAALLEARGIYDYVLLEARTTFGGRIQSMATADAIGAVGSDATLPRFDLGATWFWPTLQPELSSLITELKIPVFQQSEEGAMLIERSISAAPLLTPGYTSSPTAMRLHGGMTALIDALLRHAGPVRRRSGVQVRHIRLVGNTVEVEATNSAGEVLKWHTARVLLATPPRLVASSIVISPEPPDEMARAWRQTPTWMAPHAKYVAVYEKPFWREKRLSGEARSSVGPMAEIHDASPPSGPGALFGFLAVPAGTRARWSPTHCAMPAAARWSACSGQTRHHHDRKRSRTGRSTPSPRRLRTSSQTGAMGVPRLHL